MKLPNRETSNEKEPLVREWKHPDVIAQKVRDEEPHVWSWRDKITEGGAA